MRASSWALGAIALVTLVVLVPVCGVPSNGPPKVLDVLDRHFGGGSTALAKQMWEEFHSRKEPLENRHELDTGAVLLEMKRRQRSHEEMLSIANALKVRGARSPKVAQELVQHAGKRSHDHGLSVRSLTNVQSASLTFPTSPLPLPPSLAEPS
jgi:hypothetical protein